MVDNDMNVFTSKLNDLPDLAKNFLWQAVIIPEEGTALATLFSKIGGTEQFTIRCRMANIPGRSIESPLETHWQGSKKLYPGKTKMDGTIQLKFDEFQDLGTSYMIHAWMNLIHNNDIGLDGGDIGTIFEQKTGAAVSNYLSQYSAKVKLTVFDSTLGKDKRLPYEWILYQAWPSDFPQAQLEQEGTAKIEREVTLTYATYQMVTPQL